MDLKTREEAEKVMWELIRIMKTQKAVAKALGKPRQTFQYWLNYAKDVPYDQFLAMQELLRKKQTSQNTTHQTTPQDHSTVQQKAVLQITTLKISERVGLAMQFEKNLGQRQGRKGQNSHHVEKIRLTSDELTGRTDVIAAKKFHLGGKDNYRLAKKVVLSHNSDLIHAMDSGVVTVYHAAQLVSLAPNLIETLLASGTSAVIAFLKKRKQQTALVQRKKRCLDLSIFQNECLLKAEQNFQLPLRPALIGLLACCDECGGFHEQAANLKDYILPYIICDFKKILCALKQYGFIEKDNAVSADYWRITVIKKFVQEVHHADLVS